jgi:hypothetical protein
MTNCIGGKLKAARPAAHRKGDLVISCEPEQQARCVRSTRDLQQRAAALMGPPTSIVNC